MSEMSGSGVKLVNQNVKGLMYADDVALVAESGADFWIPSLLIATNGACVLTPRNLKSWCLVVVSLMQVFSTCYVIWYTLFCELIPKFDNFFHRSPCDTELKAFWKSMKQQNNLLCWSREIGEGINRGGMRFRGPLYEEYGSHTD